MQTLYVTATEPDNTYPIDIGHGLLRDPACFAPLKGRRAAIVTDEIVAPLYAKELENTLIQAGAAPSLLVLPAGEPTKSQAFLFDTIDFLLSQGLTRTDAVLALGGGVIGDLTGLAAALCLRGIPLWQVPTTLLSQVDSSVGGKVAINHPKGKNLLGAFYQPQHVVIDCDTLSTLPPRQIGAGLGEVIKYGCIRDADLFRQIESAGSREALFPMYEQIIHRCLSIKAAVVQEDPLDKGLRMILNYGHTLAHALENALGYGRMLHGEAVAVGMVSAAFWGERLGVTPPGTRTRILSLLKALSLPHAIPEGLSAEDLAGRMSKDKKAAGKQIRVILLDRIGACHAVPLTPDELTALLKEELK